MRAATFGGAMSADAKPQDIVSTGPWIFGGYSRGESVTLADGRVVTGPRGALIATDPDVVAASQAARLPLRGIDPSACAGRAVTTATEATTEPVETTASTSAASVIPSSEDWRE